MDETSSIKRRRSENGSFREQQKKLKSAGKGYETYERKKVPSKSPPKPQV